MRLVMEVSLKTTTRVVSSCSRDLMKSVIYFLRLNKISLISSLKSAIITAITETNKLSKSIMDSYMCYFLPRTQPNSQKKSPASKRSRAYITHIGIKPFIPFLTKTKWISNYNTKEIYVS